MKFIDAEMLKMFHTFTGDMNNKNTKDAIFLQKWPFTSTWPKVKRKILKTYKIMFKNLTFGSKTNNFDIKSFPNGEICSKLGKSIV